MESDTFMIMFLFIPVVKHGYVFKKCGPDGQWVTGPGGKSLRNADQCMIDNKKDQVSRDLNKFC